MPSPPSPFLQNYGVQLQATGRDPLLSQSQVSEPKVQLCGNDAYANVGPKTPVLPAFVGSPESDYFRAPPPKQSQSRWKSDWEELELLVRPRIDTLKRRQTHGSPGQGSLRICC